MKLLHIIVILVLHCCCLIYEMKSHDGLTSWNFSLTSKSSYNQTLRSSKIVNNFCKRLHLRCWAGFWMRLCCVLDNYIPVIFSKPPYLLLSLTCLFSVEIQSFVFFQLLPFSMKFIQLHCNWQQNRIGKVGDIIQSVSTLLRDASYRTHNKES